MASEVQVDVVSSRRNALAAIIRAFAWPLVALVAMFYFADTADRLVRSLNKASLFGFEFEKFIDNSSLNDGQMEKLEDFTAEDILTFISAYRGENHSTCLDTEEPRFGERIFYDAGLIQIQSGGCGGSEHRFSSRLSEEGIAMRRAIARMLESAIANTISS